MGLLFGKLGDRLASRKSFGGNLLDDSLFTFPTGDPFTVRDMLRSVDCKGVTGSGKSSGSGMHFLNAILRHPRSTIFAIGQKPEDREMFVDACARHKKKLLIMEPGSSDRCNILNAEMKAGADAHGIGDLLSTVSETLQAGNPQQGEQFWKLMRDRITYSAVEALIQGEGHVDAGNIMQFIADAPYSVAEMTDAEWRKKYHFQTMEKFYFAQEAGTSIQKTNFALVKNFWNSEFARMDNKPRSSALAEVMNTLHVFNSGLVHDVCSTATTFTPAVMEEGTSIFVNFPASQYGPTGRFIAGAMKFLVQKYILRRKWDGRYFNVCWLDEFQESMTEFDPRFLAQCRSHGGSMFTLTQTVHSEYGGVANRSKADQLLSNFGTHIYHTVDAQTAEYASKLLGQYLETSTSITPDGEASVGQMMFGGGTRVSVSQNWQPILKTSWLTTGLRCGGPSDNYCVDGIVIKSGTPFRNGANWQFMTFKQR